jgi:hypothetical protein
MRNITKKSNIVYFPIGEAEQTETIRAKKVAVNRDDQRVVVLAMNTPSNEAFKWGELLMMEWHPDKPLQFVAVVDRVPEGKPWRILKR